jgi:hypothetical protein
MRKDRSTLSKGKRFLLLPKFGDPIGTFPSFRANAGIQQVIKLPGFQLLPE